MKELMLLLPLLLAAAWPGPASAQEKMQAVDYDIKLYTVLTHDDADFLWFHPRAAGIPGMGKGGQPRVVMTIQRHLHKSDFYSGLFYLLSDDMGATWRGPFEPPQLGWRELENGDTFAVADVTPGWHAPSGKVIGIGIKVRYRDGLQVCEAPHDREGNYAVYDPKTDTWSPWLPLEMPEPDGKFFEVSPGCTQWIVEDDGTILLPLYFCGRDEKFQVTTVRFAFDGKKLRYVEHGDEFSLDVARGLCEPSLARFRGRYFLTIRNDEKAYVTSGDDGLHFAPIKPWVFDDGKELGSYNTQQHWVTHPDGLFLSYTRRGADNDHIMRHRAPLFVAQVDPERVCVVRETERVLVSERGATLGNFGASEVSPAEAWVTVSEGLWSADARKRGAEGATFIARMIWKRPGPAQE